MLRYTTLLLTACCLLLPGCSEKKLSDQGYHLAWQMRFAVKPAATPGPYRHFRRQYTDNYAHNQVYLGLRRDPALLYDEIFSSYFLEKEKQVSSENLPGGDYQVELVLATPRARQPAALLCHKADCRTITSQQGYTKSRHVFSTKRPGRFHLRGLASHTAVGAFRVFRKGRPLNRPNIIFIMSDTTRSDALSFINKEAHTPHIDKLAAESYFFENAFSNANWTRAALVSIFSGLHNYQAGVNTLFFEISNLERSLHANTPPPFSVMAEKNGMVSLAVMDNIFALEYTGIGVDQGFSEIYNIARDGRQAEPITKKAVELVQQYRDRPFLLFVHHNNAHKPYSPPGHYLQRIKHPTAKYSNDPEYRKYLASVSFVDDHVGRLLQAVEKAGIKQNTVIVFTSDHGEMFDKKHDWAFYHVYSGIHSHGETLYDEELRVPLVIFDPANTGPQRINQPVQTKDLYYYFKGNIKEGYPLNDWLEEHNQLPFLAEGRMSHALFNTQSKLIYHAPGYNRIRRGYYGPQSETPFQFYNLNEDNEEHKPVFDPARFDPALLSAHEQLLKQLPSYTLQVPAGDRVRLESTFGFYFLQNHCNDRLKMQLPPMPEYRPKLTWVDLANTGAKPCRVIFSPYPFHSEFQLVSRKPLQIGPLSLQIKRIPAGAPPVFWKAFYSPVEPENLKAELAATWANQPYQARKRKSEQQMNAEVKGILKSWGYIQ